MRFAASGTPLQLLRLTPHDGSASVPRRCGTSSNVLRPQRNEGRSAAEAHRAQRTTRPLIDGDLDQSVQALGRLQVRLRPAAWTPLAAVAVKGCRTHGKRHRSARCRKLRGVAAASRPGVGWRPRPMTRS